jgi:hypothetical protein
MLGSFSGSEMGEPFPLNGILMAGFSFALNRIAMENMSPQKLL